MPLVTAGYNALLSGGLSNVITFASLHNGDPSTTGANELTGGSPAYARKAVSWAGVSSGQIATNAAMTFDVPASSTVYHLGLWSAVTAGTFYGYFPAGGFAAKAASVLASSDVVTSYAHGYSDTQTVLVYDIAAAGAPTGLTEGTVYFIISSATDTFSLSTTSGGSAVNVTANGQLAVQRILPEVFAAQGQYQVASGALTLDARFV